MDKKLTNAINEQIKNEFFSAFLYLAMASYAADLELTGMQNWLLAQASEEQDHATKFVNYLHERGERAVIKGFKDPKNDYESILQVFEEALEHEKFVTSKINELMDIAHEVKDYASINFLGWYIDEQVEEEASFTTVISKLRMVSKSPMGLYQLDKELGGRAGAPAASAE